MQEPIIPENEAERLNALSELDILDTPIQKSFERITRLTKALFHVPIVSFTLIDSERQWFKSIQGLDVCETDRKVSFCGHAINQDGIFVIEDALLDPRFSDNPFVVGEPFIRFYAGYPILSPSGYKIGTICIIDTKPRSFTTEELSALKDVGALIETELASKKTQVNQVQLMKELKDAKRAQFIDQLTRLWNRGGIEKLLLHQAEFAKKTHKDFGIAIMDIDNFKSINDTYGHNAGDAVLREVSKRILSAYRENDSIGRWGGEEFLAIIDSNNTKELFNIAERVRKTVNSSPIIYENHTLSVSITIGLDSWKSNPTLQVDKMVEGPDTALYEGKKSGKNKVTCHFG